MGIKPRAWIEWFRASRLKAMTAPNVEPEPILFIVHVKKLLGKVDLLNSHTVYEGDGAYTVTSESPRDQRYECRVVPEAVEYLCARTSGQSITSARAGAILEPSV
jgi:hypothetical protein